MKPKVKPEFTPQKDAKMNETTAYTDTQQSPGIARTVILPIAAAVIALGIAVIGALIVRGDSDIDSINFFVESLSGGASRQVDGLGTFGFAFAFLTGLVAAFNPCGFVMLPAYMGLYLGVNDDNERASFMRRVWQGLLVGVSVTLGFILLFAVVGAVVAPSASGARSAVGGILPWLGLGIGVLLTIASAWLLGGGKLYTALPQQLAEKFGNPGQANIRGYFIFGLAYGLASLSCTLPLFLNVVGISSLATADIWSAFTQFILYALGMGAVIITLTLGMALFKSALIGGMRKVMPYIQVIGACFMLIAGTYIVFYWLTIGNVLG